MTSTWKLLFASNSTSRSLRALDVSDVQVLLHRLIVKPRARIEGLQSGLGTVVERNPGALWPHAQMLDELAALWSINNNVTLRVSFTRVVMACLLLKGGM